MKHLPFEKLYRGRYVHVLSQFGATYSGFVTNRCSSDKIVHVVDETGERCSVDGRFLKAYSNHRALRAATDTINRRLLTAGEMARKHIAEMERSRFMFAPLTRGDKIYVPATDKEVDVVVTLETRNELGEATEQDMRILKGRKPVPRNIALSLPTMEAYGTSLKELLSDKIPDSTTTTENFWSSDKDNVSN